MQLGSVTGRMRSGAPRQRRAAVAAVVVGAVVVGTIVAPVAAWAQEAGLSAGPPTPTTEVAETTIPTTTVTATTQPTTTLPAVDTTTGVDTTAASATTPSVLAAAPTATPNTATPTSATSGTPTSTGPAPTSGAGPTSAVGPTVVAPAPTVGPPRPPAYVTGKTMTVGSRGPAVQALEERLAALRYDVGKVDGRFDWETWQGVVAFQKVEGRPRSGRVTPEIQQALVRAVKPGALLPNGGRDRIEVDISRQVLHLYKGNALYRTISVSSGSGRKYCEISKKTGKQNCGDAVTPRGNFRIQRRISGWRESDLGKLYNPLYFDGGFAIHGAPSVPASPASHGCVRIPMSVAEWFPDVVPNGMAVYLFD